VADCSFETLVSFLPWRSAFWLVMRLEIAADESADVDLRLPVTTERLLTSRRRRAR
jgi:hypothetical protein